MYRQLVIGVACATFLATPVLAMASDTRDAGHARVPIHLSAQTHHNVAAHSERHRFRMQRLSMMKSSRGDGEVNALNSLEAAGYRKFTGMRSQGDNFAATAWKAGKRYEVTVTPSGVIRASNS
jgi:hypothetical protein